MQRQSLGSPGSRSFGLGGDVTGGGPEPSKAEKPTRWPSSRSSRAVHAVPIATLLCLLVLYLLSHDPALDLATSGSAETVLTKRADIGRYFGRGGVSAARVLMEERRDRHRKEMAVVTMDDRGSSSS